MSPIRSYLAPAALYAALLPAVSANFGNSFYLGPWDGDAYITKATYSLTAPAVIENYDTSDKSLWISIWVGVQPNVPDVSQANLVQPLLNWCADQTSCGCDAAADEWCVTASTYTPEGQTGNAYVVVPKDAKLDFESELATPCSIAAVREGKPERFCGLVLTRLALSSRCQCGHQEDRPEGDPERQGGFRAV